MGEKNNDLGVGRGGDCTSEQQIIRSKAKAQNKKTKRKKKDGDCV